MLPSHLEELLQWVVPINEKNKIPLTQVSEFAFVLRYLVAADAQETAIASYRMIALKVLRSFCWRNNEKGKKIVTCHVISHKQSHLQRSRRNVDDKCLPYFLQGASGFCRYQH